MYKTAEEAEDFAEEVKGKLPVSDQCRSSYLCSSTLSDRTCSNYRRFMLLISVHKQCTMKKKVHLQVK